MPNKITWEDKGVLSRYSGIFTPEIHIEGLSKLFGDPRVDEIQYIIGDYSEINADLLTDTHVEYPVAMTTGAASYLKNIKLALVAKDEKIVQLCQQYMQLSKKINTSWKIQLFDDLISARSWISSNTTNQ